MRRNLLLGLTALLISSAILAGVGFAPNRVEAVGDPPELSVWQRNTTGATGYNNIPSDVQQVRYSDNYVYINSTGIPSYSIGPWAANPNTASNQSYVFKIPRHPTENTGTKTSTPLGSIGVWKNGVVMFNALDAMSYQNQNIWHQNAVVVEGPSFDSCLGHPQQTGAYHHHQNPRCLYTANAAQHSPLLGYAFDGFPIYGPYGYSNANGSGGIKRIVSSYRLRNITQRRTLADGTSLSASQYGPSVSTQYPLGYYAEDYEYMSGLGDLDQYNGRFTVTPEYPNGTYAYFVTTNSDGTSAYPYIIGPSYYGVVATENITARGRVSITESVTTYSPQAATPTPAAGTIQLSAASYSINEGAINTAQGFTSLPVNVTREGDTSVAAAVQYSTSDQSSGNECDQSTGKASQRCDYAAVAGTLRFAAGDTTKTITIPIVNDGYVEGHEVFQLDLANATGANLGATAKAVITITDSGVVTSPSDNPYLNNQFFVRQNYLDFLAREPDDAGFNDWTNVLNTCGTQEGFLGSPPGCDRAHVSHGFYASPEFINTGFLIYRMYEVGMGRLPRYSEFIPDMAALSSYGLADSVWQQNLSDYLQQFTTRAEFTARFSDSMQTAEASQLITKLEQAAGVALPSGATTSAGQPTQYGRAELINLRASGQFTVGQTLKAFVEQKAIYDKYFPRGFVTMEYFAYLKRDPDLNDPGLTGWSDWVDVFTNGKQSAGIQPYDYHHLIFGFIYSEEYRKRFGQP
ncbi:MAG TPA: YHYH protein [Pyrinomonadaceae bacterium]|jgi:hypothetical protein